MNDVKCECGHANPVGTVLCESCGKPLEEEVEKSSMVEMRYDGVARRSQTYNRTIIDKIWNFFSSVKIAVWLIALTLIASMVGTIFPQEQYIPVPKPASEYYGDAFGLPGQIYYWLGFHHLYSSWWFVLLLMMIGASLVICSLDRIIPLYRALKKQRAKRHTSFLQKQKVSGQYELAEGNELENLNQLESALKKRHFRLLREGSSLLGEKGRMSRWGPYINHIGLIIFLIGVLMRFIPGFYLNQYVWVREGEIEKVPETPYYVKNESFTVEFYDQEDYPEKLEGHKAPIVKNYQTNATLYKDVNKDQSIPGTKPDLVPVEKAAIQVNHPLEYKDVLLYQSGQQMNQLQTLNLHLVNKKTGGKLGDFTLDLYHPKSVREVSDDISVNVIEYYPDLEFIDGVPGTKSPFPNNPAFIVNIVGPQTPDGEKTWIFLGSTLNAKAENRTYDITFSMPELTNISGLMVRKDKSLPVIYFGAFISLLGLIMGFYFQHRRIWFQIADGRLYIAAHTNKNWYGLKKDLQTVLDQAKIKLPVEEFDKGRET